MTPAPAPAPQSGTSPILTLRLSVRGLCDGRDHSHRLADFIGRFVASDRFDPEPLTTRLSTYLDEVFEHVIQARPGAGDLVVEVGRTAEHVLAELTLAADDALARRLREDLGQVARQDADAGHELECRPTRPGSPAAARLLDLAARHGVALTLRERPGACVIVLAVPHE